MKVLAHIRQRKTSAAIHSSSAVNIYDPVPFPEEQFECLLELGKPVADICLQTVRSIETLIVVGILVPKPCRRIGVICAVDDMGNIASDLE